eukprot:5272332-Pyramimonas_sp.AAC.1
MCIRDRFSGAPWGHLGNILGASRGFPGAPWGPRGPPGGLLGRLGSSWQPLGAEGSTCQFLSLV